MKKLSMAMAAVMLFVSCFVFTVSAENSVKVTVMTPATVTKGEELTVSVDFSENTGFNTLGVKLTYPEGFTYVDGSEAVSDLIKEACYLDFGGYQGETYAFHHDETARTITYVGASLYDVTDTAGTIFTVKFTAPETEGSGEFAVEIVDTAYNEVGDTVTVTKNNGSVDVTEITYILGDIDGVNGVTTADAMIAFFAATKKVTLTETQALAANVITADNGITTADAMRIFYYATKKITSF